MAAKDMRNKLPSYPRVYLTIERNKSGISGEELSRRLDLTKSYYYALENGTRGQRISVLLFAKIIDSLNSDANEMIENELRYIKEREMYIKDKKKYAKNKKT